MTRFTAMERALALLRDPLCLARMRAEALPLNVALVLRVLARDADADSEAARATGKSADVIREAAGLYVTQILFQPNADPYRILGCRAEATRPELRSNLALLLRWLHPDIAGPEHRNMTERVIRAWNSLKDEEARTVLDADLAKKRDNGRRRKDRPSRPSGRAPANRQLPRQPQSAGKAPAAGQAKSKRRLLILVACFVGGLVGAALLPGEIFSNAVQLVASFYETDTPKESASPKPVGSGPKAELSR